MVRAQLSLQDVRRQLPHKRAPNIYWVHIFTDLPFSKSKFKVGSHSNVCIQECQNSNHKQNTFMDGCWSANPRKLHPIKITMHIVYLHMYQQSPAAYGGLKWQETSHSTSLHIHIHGLLGPLHKGAHVGDPGSNRLVSHLEREFVRYRAAKKCLFGNHWYYYPEPDSCTDTVITSQVVSSKRCKGHRQLLRTCWNSSIKHYRTCVSLDLQLSLVHYFITPLTWFLPTISEEAVTKEALINQVQTVLKR